MYRRFSRKINFRVRINPKWILLLLILFVFVVLAIPLVAYLTVSSVYMQRIFAVKDVPEVRVGIIMGGSDDESDPNLLQDRITTAGELYKNGKIQKLLINNSGSRSIDSIEGLSIKAGIRQFDLKIEKDVAAIYDACFIARNKYTIDKAIIITQERYALPALYACNSIGIDSYGVIADRQLYINNPGLLANFGQVFSIFWNIYVQEPDLADTQKVSL